MALFLKKYYWNYFFLHYVLIMFPVPQLLPDPLHFLITPSQANSLLSYFLFVENKKENKRAIKLELNKKR